MSSIKRKSAAVMFTDIAGYTSVMASDEEKALSLLQNKRNIIKPLIEKYDGIYNRILNSLDEDEKAKFLNSIWCKRTIEEWNNQLQ